MDSRLLWALVIAIVIEIMLPVFLAIWFTLRRRVSLYYFLSGAAIFFLFQIVTRVPIITWLQNQFAGALALSELNQYLFLAFEALTAGLFEEGGRYLGYRVLWNLPRRISWMRSDRKAPFRPAKKTWARAVMYGLGHGGCESAWVGVLTMGALFDILARPSAAAGIPWWSPLVGPVERAMTIVIQVSLAVIVLQVFTRKQGFWWWLAFGYHVLVDFVSIGVPGMLSPWLSAGARIALAEGLVLIFALLSAWIIYRLRPSEPEEEAAPLEQTGDNLVETDGGNDA